MTVVDPAGADSTGNLLRDNATRLFQLHCDTNVLRAADQGAWADALWSATEEAGLTKALLPDSAGGFGVPVADALSLLRVAAAHAVPLPLGETMLAGWFLAKVGIPVPDGPLAVGPVRLDESLVLDGGTVRGTLTRIPWGRNLAGLVAIATVNAVPHAVLVSPEAWTVEPGENVAREPRDTLRLDGRVVADVAAPALDAQVIMAAGAAIRTQQIAGALTRLTEMTVQYAQDRVQFGRPIGKFQAVQQNLAIMAGQSAAAVAGADLAADALAADPVRLLPIAAGKARAGEAASIAAAIAHQVHGAIGFTLEHPLHFLTRRLWSWRDEFGKDAYWTRALGRHMAREGGDRLWANITDDQAKASPMGSSGSA